MVYSLKVFRTKFLNDFLGPMIGVYGHHKVTMVINGSVFSASGCSACLQGQSINIVIDPKCSRAQLEKKYKSYQDCSACLTYEFPNQSI